MSMISLPALSLGRFFGGKRKGAAKRRFERHPCMIVATMTVTDKHFDVDGLVTEISVGGLRFRPASTYILDRRNEVVSISMEGLVVPGVIKNVSEIGYGIMLTNELDPNDVELFARDFRKLF